jgi:hypothetical protein
MNSRISCALIVLVITISGSALGQVFDANVDFNGSLDPPGPGGTNPNGVWTYSWSEGLFGSLVPFPELADPAPVNCDVEAIWIDPPIDDGFTPSVGKSIYGPCHDGNVDFEENELILHGGGVGGNKYGVVVFTAPESETCNIAATFTGRQNYVYVDVHVMVNSVSVFDDTITANGASTSYFGTEISLTTGDIVSFAVGPNGYLTLHPGNTAVEAVIACGPIFSDDFESGDTTAWSAVVP